MRYVYVMNILLLFTTRLPKVEIYFINDSILIIIYRFLENIVHLFERNRYSIANLSKGLMQRANLMDDYSFKITKRKSFSKTFLFLQTNPERSESND